MKCDDRLRANPLVVLREEFDDWAILFDPDSGNAFGLSPTGVYLWKHLDGQHSIDDMLEALRRDAEDVPAEAGDHIREFLADLTKRGLAGYEVG
jgi:SynChlorMet cassette protein ScmD